MTTALMHRGPDDEGFVASPHCAAGMRRLSIIDLAGGHQPISNEDGRVSIILNGEIYNFRELRSALESKGHHFRTQSDTETVVHAYEEWGIECVQHLRGMFAFAVFDARDAADGGGRLFLARDRFGIKPLYYAWADDVFLFASEVRALLASGLLPRRLSHAALDSYLLFGSVSEPLSLIEGVRSLPPGHRMLLTASEVSTARPEVYWKPAATSPATVTLPSEQTVMELRARLEEAIRLHLIADVPLGVFLSSGIDSTAIAALASRERSGMHTFTVAFPETEFSEAVLARETAKKLGTHHQELLLSEQDLLARLDAAVAALDQPSMDGINTYFVSWAARQAGLKVALSGLGGDEVFGGYSTFRTTPQVERVAAVARRLPAAFRAATASALAAVAKMSASPDAWRKLASVWRNPEALPQPFFFTRTLFTLAQATCLRRERRVDAESPAWMAWLESVAGDASRFDDFTAISWLEARSYMVNTLLRDTDAMSMAHSLEVRVPFLDHVLFEFVAALPEAVKRGSRPKALLVESLGDLLPKNVLTKPKQTFTLPWEHWLRGALEKRVAKDLSNLHPALAEALDAAQVRAVWQEFLAGRTGWSRPWSLYVLNAWAGLHLDFPNAEGKTGAN